MTRLVFDGFVNDGFGWSCRYCAEPVGERHESGRSRLMSEGEAEAKVPALSSQALAKWSDREAKILECPTCGRKEQGNIINEDS